MRPEDEYPNADSTDSSGFSDEGDLLDEEDDTLLVEAISLIKKNRLEKVSELMSQISKKSQEKLQKLNSAEEQKDNFVSIRDCMIENVKNFSLEEDKVNESEDEARTNLNKDKNIGKLKKSLQEEIEALDEITSDDEDKHVLALTSFKKTTTEEKADTKSNAWQNLPVSNENEDKWLLDYFGKALWKTKDAVENINLIDSSGDLKKENYSVVINDEVDEKMVQAAEDAEDDFNHGGTHVEKHARTEGFGFDKIFKETKRMRRRRKKKLELEANVELNKKKVKRKIADINKLLNSIDDNVSSDSDFADDQEWFLCDNCYTAIEEGKAFYTCVECEMCYCTACQKKVIHEHSLRKTKCQQRPPKNWKLIVRDMIKEREPEIFANYIVSSLKFKPDEEFVYVQATSVDKDKRKPEEIVQELLEDKFDETKTKKFKKNNKRTAELDDIETISVD